MISSAYSSLAKTAVRTRLRLVRLVDRERVVRDQVAERVRDPHEQRVEALLREHLVEHVGKPLVRLDELQAPQARKSPASAGDVWSAAQPSELKNRCPGVE